MAVAVTGTPASSSGAFLDVLTFSLTVPSGATLLLVGVNWGTDQTVSTVTFNGDSLTRLGGAGPISGIGSDIWYRVNPDVATGDVVVTMTGAVSNRLGAGAVAFSGTDTSTPLDTIQTEATTANPQPSLAVSSATDDMVFDTIACDDSAINVGASQTQHFQTGGAINNAGSTEPGATTVTMSWSALANFTTYAHAAVNINQASAGIGAAEFMAATRALTGTGGMIGREYV